MLGSAKGLGPGLWARENQAVRIGQPRPRHRTGSPGNRLGWRLGASLACAAHLILGAVVWGAYDEVGRHARSDQPALVSAAATPAKALQGVAGGPVAKPLPLAEPADRRSLPESGRRSEHTRARAPAAPLPALKPLAAVASAAAPGPTLAAPPLPAFKPDAMILAAGARATNACASSREGVLPRDCAVRLAGARDQGSSRRVGRR